jgi:peptidoglycan/xylan/chitin deacetylase (PgdA/CDA1 family)
LDKSISIDLKNSGIERDKNIDKLEEDIIKNLAPFYNELADYWKLMENKHIVELSSNKLIEIGSHTENHYNLPFLNKKEIEAELSNSKNYLENLILKSQM